MSFMHELGHTLGLGHSCSNEGFKPNYLSVMNYGFEFENNVKDRPLDFSRVQLPDLFEKKLDETLGLRKTAGESWPPPGARYLRVPTIWHRTITSRQIDKGTASARCETLGRGRLTVPAGSTGTPRVAPWSPTLS